MTLLFSTTAFADYHMRRLVPLKFHTSSGLRSYEFRVLLANWWPAFREERARGLFRCVLRRGVELVPTVVSRETLPSAFEALTLVASVDGETARPIRYLAVHSAYECVVATRDPDLSAIRHALAHPSKSLTSRATVASLNRRFGSTIIDLDNYFHKKEFYRCLAKMLMAVDDAVFKLLDDGRDPQAPTCG